MLRWIVYKSFVWNAHCRVLFKILTILMKMNYKIIISTKVRNLLSFAPLGLVSPQHFDHCDEEYCCQQEYRSLNHCLLYFITVLISNKMILSVRDQWMTGWCKQHCLYSDCDITASCSKKKNEIKIIVSTSSLQC